MAAMMAVMASRWFRMVNSFAMMRAGLIRPSMPSNAPRAASFPKNARRAAANLAAANLGIFAMARNPLKRQASPIVEPRPR
jgi:hypothetical protein